MTTPADLADEAPTSPANPARVLSQHLGAGLVAFVGNDREHGEHLAHLAGEYVPAGWATISVLDARRALLLLVHAWTGPGGSVALAFDNLGLRLTRRVLAYLADVLLRDLAVAETFVRLDACDRTRRHALERLGFAFDGLEYVVGRPVRARFRLTPDRLPARFTRWRARRAH